VPNFAYIYIYVQRTNYIYIYIYIYEEKWGEASTVGQRYITFLASEFGGNERLLERAIEEGEVKKVWKDEQLWLYKATDAHRHRKGWKEETKGSSSKRSLEDADMDAMMGLLKESGWEFSLSKKEEQKMIEGDALPTEVKDKLNACFLVYRLCTVNLQQS